MTSALRLKEELEVACRKAVAILSNTSQTLCQGSVWPAAKSDPEVREYSQPMLETQEVQVRILVEHPGRQIVQGD